MTSGRRPKGRLHVRFSLIVATLAVASLAIALPASGAADIYVVIAGIKGEPQYDCNDAGCGKIVIGYSFTGPGTCQSGCLSWPSGSTETALSFSVARTFTSDACRMKTGTGTLDLSWPDDPLAVARATLMFKARDSHTIAFTGAITSSTTSALRISDRLKGFVGFPPNPCDGGTTSGSITFSRTT